jgi:hypothetical protein
MNCPDCGTELYQGVCGPCALWDERQKNERCSLPGCSEQASLFRQALRKELEDWPLKLLMLGGVACIAWELCSMAWGGKP